MAYFLFVDESGQDHRQSPYEVLAGVAVLDSSMWSLVTDLHAAEVRNFGCRYSQGSNELKGKKLLKTKVFQHASLNFEVDADDIPTLAAEALQNGAAASIKHLKALAIAKQNYVRDVFSLCRRYGCRAFASVVETDAHPTESDGLRKDYSYLFERFYYFLEDMGPDAHQGVIVFDELEKAQSHILIDQSHRYFKESAKGRLRSGAIIPEPFFVHSDLTTGVQLADLVAYTISWGFRTPQMLKPARTELAPFAKQVSELRYRAVRELNGNPNFTIWSVAHITDLRTRQERGSRE